MKETTAPQIKQLSLSVIAEDLNNGLTKWKKDDIGFGSIEKKYNLLTNEAIELFGHPKVKKMETRIPTFIIVDDLPNEEPASTEIPESHKSWMVETQLRRKESQTKIEIVQPKNKVEAFI